MQSDFPTSVSSISLDRIPAFAQALQVGVAVLRDHRGDPLRMANGESKTNWRAVVENIKRVADEADRLREPLDLLRQVLEAVFEAFSFGRFGEAEAR